MTTPTAHAGVVIHEGRKLTPADARREAEALFAKALELEATARQLQTAAERAEIQDTTATLEPALLAHLDKLEAEGARVSRSLSLDVTKVSAVVQLPTGALAREVARFRGEKVIITRQWATLPEALQKLRELRLRVAGGRVAHVVSEDCCRGSRWNCTRCGAWVEPTTSEPAHPDLRLCGTPRRPRAPAAPSLFTDPSDA